MAKIHGQLIRAAVETLSSDPSTTANKFTGRLWFNTTTHLIKYTDDSNVVHAFVDADTAQTLTNKTLSDSTTYFADESDSTKKMQFQLSGITTGNTRVLTVPDYNGTIATLAGTETFTNKTLSDSTTYFADESDSTKKMQFQLSGITTGNTRVLTVPNFDGTIATLAGTETFTNKTLSDSTTYFADESDSTKKMQFQLSGITTGNTRVLTVPNFDGTIATLAGSETFTNKTIVAANNTMTGFILQSIIDAKGDLVVGSSADTAAILPATTNGYILTVNSAATYGIEWAAPASAPVSALEFTNVGLSCSVAASALTIALKQADGSTDPSAGSAAVKIGTRSSTATSGAFNTRSVTGSLSMTVSSGSTLGHVSGVNRYIYVYVIDNAGTLELAVSSKYYDGGSIISTTAEGGAGAADVNDTIYSTTARSNVAIRCIGRLKSNQATAGTWASAPTEVSVGDSWNDLEKSSITLDTHAGFGSTNTKVAYFTNSTVVGTAMSLTTNNSTSGATITINEPGLYAIFYTCRYGASSEDYWGVGLNASGTTGLTSLTHTTRIAAAGGERPASTQQYITASVIWPLSVGDVITPHHTLPTTPGTTAASNFRIVKISQNSV